MNNMEKKKPPAEHNRAKDRFLRAFDQVREKKSKKNPLINHNVENFSLKIPQSVYF